MLIIIEGYLDAVDNLKDSDPTKRFSVYTTSANAVHL